MKLPFVIVKRSTLDSLLFDNASLSASLATLHKRFAANILYGETAPKQPVDAALKAMANMEKYHD